MFANIREHREHRDLLRPDERYSGRSEAPARSRLDGWGSPARAILNVLQVIH
jgi:hypothetical protein